MDIRTDISKMSFRKEEKFEHGEGNRINNAFLSCTDFMKRLFFQAVIILILFSRQCFLV